jgi:hypothetical protein
VKNGAEPGQKGLGRPAHADQPGPFSARFDLLFVLVPPRAIKSLDAKSHGEIHSSSTATRPRIRRRLDHEGSTCGLHLLRKILHHDRCYNV